MKAGDVQVRLAANNRWWRDPEGWESEDPELRKAAKAPFTYRPGALKNLVPGGLYVLRGPRRAGKSTEIKYAIKDLLKRGIAPQNIIHASVDEWRASDLRSLVDVATHTFLASSQGTRYWFIDEISSVEGNWPATIKNMRDSDPQFSEDTVILTGSSADQLHKARKSLAGRRGDAADSDRSLLPMSFTSFVDAAGIHLPEHEQISVRDINGEAARDHINALLPYLADLVPLWETYLRVGGFPQAVTQWRRGGDVSPSLVNALWDVVYGDAMKTARFSALQTTVLLGWISSNLCSPLNIASLATELEASRETTNERLADLVDNFLVWPCRRERGMTARLGAQSKWYFTDPLLARIPALRNRRKEPDLTKLSQQQIGLALLQNVDSFGVENTADYDQVLYYRSSTGAEIDFVGQKFGNVAVESKYTDGKWGRELQTLRSAPWFGLLASRSGVEWHTDSWVIPAPFLAIILGA